MFNFKAHVHLLLMTTLLNSSLLIASDRDKEMRWFEQINESIMTGDTIWLKANDEKFLGIYTESQTDKVLGGVIVVHGLGVHPNWSDVILPIRTNLPEEGWATLSIQMPILQNNASPIGYLPLFDEVLLRFDAAMEYLRSKNIDNVAIVAHSLGSVMSVHYLTQNKKYPIRAFVGVGLSSDNSDERLNVAKSFSHLKLPIYDIYGSYDLKSVISSADERKQSALSSANKDYTQEMVQDADHFFVDMDDLLVSKVNNWLLKNATQ